MERTLCLWLVPSNTIRDQTLAALRDRQHPYRQAIQADFSGNVCVMDLGEALYVQRSSLDGEQKPKRVSAHDAAGHSDRPTAPSVEKKTRAV